MTSTASLWDVLRVSVGVAAWATLAAAPFAIGLGWLLARRRFRGKAIVSTLVFAPLVMPPVVTGFLLLALLGRRGPLGSWLHAHGIDVMFAFPGAVIPAVVVGLPLFVAVARNAFETVDRRQDEIAATLGLSPWATFRRVTLPLAFPGVLAGAVLSFARALGEFGATQLLVGNGDSDTQTISLAVNNLLAAVDGESHIWPLVGVSVALSFAAIAGFELLVERHRRLLELDRGR